MPLPDRASHPNRTSTSKLVRNTETAVQRNLPLFQIYSMSSLVNLDCFLRAARQPRVDGVEMGVGIWMPLHVMAGGQI